MLPPRSEINLPMTFYPLRNVHLIWWGEMTLWWLCPQTFWRVHCSPVQSKKSKEGWEEEERRREGDEEIKVRRSVTVGIGVFCESDDTVHLWQTTAEQGHILLCVTSFDRSWTTGQWPLSMTNVQPVLENWRENLQSNHIVQRWRSKDNMWNKKKVLCDYFLQQNLHHLHALLHIFKSYWLYKELSSSSCIKRYIGQ